ncbi:maleylpyruvate isomerase N-terminal domain-containing protein [Krasilnikovia sp. MM14-A1259]|uniref:maleylpyruvate isomerase N-terminal domain-containing protein n=1 Tax=Krasilnikovia sp. MM14-A1259 TaxID=3373539 RepID=UPI00382FBF01
MTTKIFLDSAAAVAPLLRAPELATRWAEPSALTEFRISGLAGHLARAVFNVERYLDADAITEPPTLDAVSYFRTAGGPDADDPQATVHRLIRERGEQDAANGPLDLADRYDAARARLAQRLADLDGDRPVLMFGRYVLTLHECLLTRLVELVVHADDLAVSLELPTPEFGDEADDMVIKTLARISRRRHGTLPVLRTLARRERASSPVSAF